LNFAKSKDSTQSFWFRYWPLLCCPIVAFATWNGPPGISMLFALLVLRDYPKWREPWGGIIGFLVCFGCIIASAVAAFRHFLR
jgi:hypothetical protein